MVFKKGYKMTEEHKNNIAKALIGRKLSEEHKNHISKVNQGKTISEETKIKIGLKHKGKHLTEEHIKKLSEAHIGINQGEESGMWKGDKVKYSALHEWIRNHKPKSQFCENCNSIKPLQIANISGLYKRDINDYQWLCAKCHIYKDGTIFNLRGFN